MQHVSLRQKKKLFTSHYTQTGQNDEMISGCTALSLIDDWNLTCVC